MNDEKEKFNLITQPWIPCRMIDGHPSQLTFYGIEDVLKEAHNIHEIVGENPLVTISLHRLLLAVLYRCFGALSYNGEWQEVWKEGNGAFEAAKLEGYLRRQDYPVSHNDKDGVLQTINIFERFYLFDDKSPFYQFRNAVEPKEDKNFSAKLFFHDEKSPIFFEHKIPSQTGLTSAEAARLLVAFQGFDVGGTKTQDSGKTKPDKTEASPLLKAAVGLAKGQTLFQTLMLNLYWDDDSFFKDHLSGKDIPAWERDGDLSFETREPMGILDLLTWQSRRLKLYRRGNQEVIAQAIIMAGEKMPPSIEKKTKTGESTNNVKRFSREKKEPMIAFKFRKEDNGYTPVIFRPDRVLWRDSHTIFQTVRNESGKKEHSMLLLDWLGNLKESGALAAHPIIPIDFLGMNPNKAKPLFWRHERLPLPVNYLSNENINEELQRALAFCDQNTFEALRECIRRFTLLILWPQSYDNKESKAYFAPLFDRTMEATAKSGQRKLEIEKKGKEFPQTVDKRAESFSPGTHYWPRLENPFRVLLLGLARNLDDWPQQREQWAKAVERAANQTIQEIIGGTADSTRTLRAAAVTKSWFEAKFNAARNNYLKGGFVPADFNDPDNTDEDEEQDDDE